MSCTNGALEPSPMGSSGPSTSTRAASIPEPTSAASRCSTVPMRTPARPSDVQSTVSTTHDAIAGMSSSGATSVRTNVIPESGAAGASVTRTVWPLWSPTPSNDTRCLKVRWWKDCPSIVRSLVPWKVRQRPVEDFPETAAVFAQFPYALGGVLQGVRFPGVEQIEETVEHLAVAVPQQLVADVAEFEGKRAERLHERYVRSGRAEPLE